MPSPHFTPNNPMHGATMEESRPGKTKSANEPNRLARIASGQKVEAVIHEQVLKETPAVEVQRSIFGTVRSKHPRHQHAHPARQGHCADWTERVWQMDAATQCESHERPHRWSDHARRYLAVERINLRSRRRRDGLHSAWVWFSKNPIRFR